MFFLQCNGVDAYEVPQHVLEAGRVRTASAEKLAKKYDMHICGTGGAMMGCVNEIGIAFTVYRPLNKEEGRELIVKCVQEFLEDINNDIQLRPYLVSYPFDVNHVEMGIFSEDPSRKPVCYPYFSIISSYKGRITYLSQKFQDDKKYQCEERETFQQALQIVREASQPS
jgi:hypothetical protein